VFKNLIEEYQKGIKKRERKMKKGKSVNTSSPSNNSAHFSASKVSDHHETNYLTILYRAVQEAQPIVY
jgi:hypothetical protein